MPNVTGGQAVVDALIAEGVEVVFGIPGEHTIPLYDALYNSRDKIRHILARHEQGAGFMAEGYAMATGRVGVCITTTGPGAFNALTALHEAYGDSMPVLLITSEIDRRFIGQERGITHQSKDQLGVLERASGWAAQANTVEDIPRLMHEAFVRMRSGRPRPAVVQIPLDVLAETGEADPIRPERPAPQAADAGKIAEAAALLKSAHRPIIWAGGGINISGANDALREVAERLTAAVIVTPDGKGAIPEDHPLALGNTSNDGPTLALMRKADAALVVGTRFQQRITRGWKLPIPSSMVQIDVDPVELGKNYPATIGLAGDARLTLEQLAGQLAGLAPKPTIQSEVQQARAAIEGFIQEHAAPEAEMIDVMRARLARDAVFFSDTARGSAWLRGSLPVYAPRSFFTPGGFSTLGFAVPAAIGAKAAFPNRQVYAVCGDGSFMFTCNELGTAVQERLNVIFLLFNNQAHQGIKDHQEHECGGRIIAADLVQPDFVRFGESFGMLGLRVERLDQLGSALDEARESSRPALIEIAFDVCRPPKVPEGALI